jgi:hypothetical protein
VIDHLAALRDVMSASPLVVLGVLAGLMVFTVAAVVGSRWAAAALIPLSGAWLLSNQLVEGDTLLSLSWNHGVTTADLVSFAALLVAAWRLLPPIAAFLLDAPR